MFIIRLYTQNRLWILCLNLISYLCLWVSYRILEKRRLQPVEYLSTKANRNPPCMTINEAVCWSSFLISEWRGSVGPVDILSMICQPQNYIQMWLIWRWRGARDDTHVCTVYQSVILTIGTAKILTKHLRRIYIRSSHMSLITRRKMASKGNGSTT